MYLIDANIVIGTWRTYPPTIFETLWEKFAALIPGGDLYFHEEVKRELTAWSSVQAEWVKHHVPNNRIMHPTQIEVEKYKEISAWAQFEREPKAKQKAIDNFLGAADSWLVASAMANNATIVSNEVSARHSTANIKLPDVANHFGVRYLDFLAFLEEKGITV